MTAFSKPTPIGTNYANVGVGSAVVQLVTPSQNLHGLVIRTCYLNAVSGVMGVQLFADTAAPSAFGDPTKRLIFLANPIPTFGIHYPIYVPPGQGLWAVASGPNASINMTYDLLASPLM